MKYDLILKGHVGGWNFNPDDVDEKIEKSSGQKLNILIRSLGGSLASGLAISSTFKRHGDVHVHFVGLNASAATIASIGARHISMDKNAMYLVHKCSVEFFQWASLNADQFRQMVQSCSMQIEDLDKIDRNLAAMYASRCNLPEDDMMKLMERGGWISAKEALDYGFVDEITDYPEDKTQNVSDELLCEMSVAGIPTAGLPMPQPSGFRKILESLAGLAKSLTGSAKTESDLELSARYPNIAAIEGMGNLRQLDDRICITQEQLEAIESALGQSTATTNDKGQETDDKAPETPDSKQITQINDSDTGDSGSDDSAAARYLQSYSKAAEFLKKIR